jgi:hypothetical protein
MSFSSLALQAVLVPAFRAVAVTVLDLGLPVLSSKLSMSVDILLGLLVEEFQSLDKVPDDWEVCKVNQRVVNATLPLVSTYERCIANEKSPYGIRLATIASRWPWAPCFKASSWTK